MLFIILRMTICVIRTFNSLKTTKYMKVYNISSITHWTTNTISYTQCLSFKVDINTFILLDYLFKCIISTHV